MTCCFCTSRPNGTRLSVSGLDQGSPRRGYEIGPPCTRPSLGSALGWAVLGSEVVGQTSCDDWPGPTPVVPVLPPMARTAITPTTMITTSRAAAAIHHPTGDLRCWAVWKLAYAPGWPCPYAFC